MKTIVDLFKHKLKVENFLCDNLCEFDRKTVIDIILRVKNSYEDDLKFMFEKRFEKLISKAKEEGYYVEPHFNFENIQINFYTKITYASPSEYDDFILTPTGIEKKYAANIPKEILKIAQEFLKGGEL